ncbi:MAG: RNA polymerase sigma factor [Patescibacteria group bacterium]
MNWENPTVSEFSKLYEEHKNVIFNYILYRVGFNKATAEDLTSEIFLKAWKAFETFDRSRSFKTWVFAIAHNHLVNFYASGKKQTLSLDEAIEIVKELPSSEKLNEKLEIENVMKIVKMLPESQQELVIMKYVNDMSNTEIAQALNKEEGAIRTALSRSLTAIRNQYPILFTEKSNG